MEKITPGICDEIRIYEEQVTKFLAGEVGPDSFQRFRLQHGIYGQRQDGVQMVRIKIPLGILTAEQIECIADLAETIAHNNAHITTRQDIQIHYVRLENTIDMMRKLAAVGLTTREACGNTVRNVTASPSAGVDPKEAFDVTPYAHAFACHFLRNPINQNLPRKFKVAFDGGGLATALPLIHDIGLIARIQGRRRGFEVFVGGGLGSYPVVAKKFFDFMPVEELLRFAEAILRLFDRYGERRIRGKARMKFLIEKFGFEKFSRLVREEFNEVELPPEANDYLKHLEDREESPPQPPSLTKRGVPSEAGGGDFLEWKKTNVTPQKQSGYSMVEIRLTTGDMAPRQMRPLADLLRRYAGGKLRTMVHQNLLIRWVRDQDLPAVYEELKAIGMVKKDPQTIYDVTACPGTDTCRLGIASSMGLARVIESRLYQEDGKITALARDLRIKISGCPNSCGQHHIANIGFYGGAIPTNGHTLPAFQLMLGGDFGRETVIAAPIEQIPSKNVPDTVVRLVRHYAEKREKGETFNQFYKRIGKEQVIQLLQDLARPPAFKERPDFYTDWEDQKEFALQKGVIGECAGQMKEDVPPKVADGDPLLAMAKAHQAHGQYESVAHKAYEAVVKSANGLLYLRLVSTFNDIETTHEFENHFGRTGILPQWKDFHKKVQTLRKKKVDEKVSEEWFTLAKEFLKSCHDKEPEVAASSPRKPAGPQPDTLAL
ncbi:MAG: nitrite/sulfite reductase [Deltaproteobacteria bacterium]|nr:nitrite/sulfite reductase [Deltaproteobacteria bacterium]MBI4373707.1 nitrite/sulfite reductase [Deltaproteobacteria bacterium]